jgi:hypothetical protein
MTAARGIGNAAHALNAGIREASCRFPATPNETT